MTIRARFQVAASALLLVMGGASVAHAGDRGAIVVWPTLTPAGDDASPLPLHRPSSAEPQLLARAQELDATLRDAVQDLGFTLDVAAPGPESGHARDVDLLARAASSWVVSARLEPAGGGDVLVRLVAVATHSHELRVRVEAVKEADLAVRALVMLRDLLTSAAGSDAAHAGDAAAACGPSPSAPGSGVMTTGLRSPGRAVLSVNGALFGAYAAYSVQRASGSDDPRVLYPLLALGTGIGLGSALLVSDEWDLSPGDAWFLAAGAWWGAAAGVLIANGERVDPLPDRYAWGVGSGFVGLGVATFGLTRRRMDEGGAVLTHSGGALGLFLGGVVDLAYRGTLNATPYSGAGFGAAVGVLGAGTLATLMPVSASRVLLIDLGAGLGALASAAAASPLLLGDVVEGSRTRYFLAATAGGTLLGGGLGWFLTRGSSSGAATRVPGQPMVGVVGSSATPTGAVPAYGLGWGGQF